MFEGCVSLSYIPDVSKWNICDHNYNMFNDCLSLLS